MPQCRSAPARRGPSRAAVLGVFVLAGSTLFACSDDGETQTGGDIPAEPDLVIESQDIAFHPGKATVDAGREIVIVHDNRDDGTSHNLHLRDAPDSPKTPLEEGPVEQVLRVTLEPGEYHYSCDLHPNMRGTLRAR